jgi:hypothetical protein
VNHSLASALAWKLQVPERRVHAVVSSTGYVFNAPRNRNTGSKPRIKHRAARSVQVVLTLQPWSVALVRRLGEVGPPRCKPGDRAT